MFDYYEIVRITSCPGNPEMIGKNGYVAGKSYEDGGPVEGYGVFIFDVEEVYSFDSSEIVSLGRFIDPAETVSGERVRIKNDGGKGVIVDGDVE